MITYIGGTEYAYIRGKAGDLRAIPGVAEGKDWGEVQSLFTGDFDGSMMTMDQDIPEAPLPDGQMCQMLFEWSIGEDEGPASIKEPLEEIAKALPGLEIALGIWEQFKEGEQAFFFFSPKGSGVLTGTSRADLFAQAEASGWDLAQIWQDPEFDVNWDE